MGVNPYLQPLPVATLNTLQGNREGSNGDMYGKFDMSQAAVGVYCGVVEWVQSDLFASIWYNEYFTRPQSSK